MTQVVQPPKDQDDSKLRCKPQCKFPLNEKAGFQFFIKRLWWIFSVTFRYRYPTPWLADEREETEEKL